MATGGAGGERICSMAFGPGLTVETALFTRLQAPQPAAETSAAETSDADTSDADSAGAEPAQPVAVRA